MELLAQYDEGRITFNLFKITTNCRTLPLIYKVRHGAYVQYLITLIISSIYSVHHLIEVNER